MRQLSIGIQAGETPSAAEWVLDETTLKSVAKVRAQIALTVYSPVIETKQSPSNR